MADKTISELIAASQVTPTDLFVLEQNGTAKKLTGQTLENWLVSFADGHGGIQSIVKHSTSGLKDTYRITLADTTTFDLIVTNGKAISSVEQTYEEGLTRTYTIAFNDNTSQTFTVTDGRSITNIEKTATNVLTDTYTISFNDGTTSTFTVKNGKGISSFAKVSTVGLVDTYRIEYTDNTSDEFVVTNGAKGDKGDNTYTHIKFASQEPTESSHSFGDIPDEWIGFYWGNSEEAPTDWKQYKWHQFKGDKGDTGDAATLISSAVEYQVSDSGTIIPSGSWLASIPVVTQGRYLWTRTTNNFNTGNPVVSYSVARMGMDGSGSVSAVAGISPDEDGNVPLTAADVHALPETGGDLTGELRMNGQPISGLNPPTKSDQAANMGFVNEQVKKASPFNHLINSNFRNPINTNGKTSYTGSGYSINEWRAYHATTTHAVTSDGIKLSATDANAAMYQVLDVAQLKTNAKYTAAAMDSTGKIYIWTGYITNTSAGAGVAVYVSGSNTLFRIYGAATWVWAALYEGEYNIDTLPEYQPKGYETELFICRQYDPATGAYIGLRKFGYAHNLLDNSDFTNPVNQRATTNLTPGTTKTYFIDRWCSARTVVSVTNGGVRFAWDGKNDKTGYIQQIIPGNWKTGDVFTIALKVNGEVICGVLALAAAGTNVTYQPFSGVAVTTAFSGTNQYLTLNTSRTEGILVEWIALYEGAYTLDTLPEYQPKGYETELLICRQYDSTNGAYIGLQKFGQPRNLLDNSDFRNPVNQRGATSYTNSDASKMTFAVDRWKFIHGTFTVADGYIRYVSAKGSVYKRIVQVANMTIKAGKTYTIAIRARINEVGNLIRLRPCDSSYGTVSGASQLDIKSKTSGFETFLVSFTPANDVVNPGFDLLCFNTANDYVNIDIEWAAWYEGAYTLDTLPDYQPKGYGAELAECRRYFKRLGGVSTGYVGYGSIYSTNDKQLLITLPMAGGMVPGANISATKQGVIRCFSNVGTSYEVSSVTYYTQDSNNLIVVVTMAAALDGGKTYLLRTDDTAYIDIIAE